MDQVLDFEYMFSPPVSSFLFLLMLCGVDVLSSESLCDFYVMTLHSKKVKNEVLKTRRLHIGAKRFLVSESRVVQPCS